ncbi:MAG TPA: helix-turn-helix domain-containing protein [Solirubrobacteraceae bacterium]|jgi:AcrR family transcriptional regulator|nr:helix-turn-helix domain-containing protein [Solirubrobacteraceae bacterium]
MASNPAPRWQRLEHDERRRQILVVARRLFSERSYAAVSTSDIAREAGVARGLLHHYFGTKRELYLEVVRALVLMPSNPVPLSSDGGLEVVIGESVDRWLEMLERNRGTWLAAVGAQGLGRDVEVEAILDEAREQAVDRLIEAVEPDEVSPELRAVLRAYSGLAESASLEWLHRDRLTREQVQMLLVESFLALVREVLPAVEGAGGVTQTSQP